MTIVAACLASSSTIALPMPLLPPVTTATFPFRLMMLLRVDCVTSRSVSFGQSYLDRDCRPGRGHLRALSLEPIEQVVADSQCVGHGGQRGVDSANAGEKAGIDHVEVVELVRLAVRVQHRRLGVAAEA